jgi:L-alanine-DL-glutamate epimerase-like enolase superfamily enzyme
MSSASLTRRDFLGTGLCFGLAASGTASIVQAADRKPLADLALRRVEAFALRRLVLARVEATDGTVGWGECGHSGGGLVARTVNEHIAALLRDFPVFAHDAAWRRVYHELDELGPGGIVSQALAGVDCALWDLRGRMLGLPVHALLGGRVRDRIPLYGSFSRDAGNGRFKTPETCAQEAAALVAEGFRTVKLRLAIREENRDPNDDPALPCAVAVREAVGPDVELWIDANNGYSAARAVRVGRALAEQCGVTLFEEPVAAYHYASLATVARELPIDVAAGEHEYTRWAFRDLVLHGQVDVLNPDVGKMGGLTDALRVATIAELFDKTVCVHNARPTLLTAAHLHFAAAVPAASRPQEHPSLRRLDELWRYFRNRNTVAEGWATVSDAPGLGLEVDEDAVRRDATAQPASPLPS